MTRIVFVFLLTLLVFGRNNAQSTAYVFQGGLSLGTQKWDNAFSRQPLVAYHYALAIESVNNDDDRSSLFMQIGYHVKGSATRFRYYNISSGFPVGFFSQRFEFRNISLIFGAKQKFPLGVSGNAKYYYFGGIRGDYTLNTNIDELAAGQLNPGIYPFIGAMNRWMVGVSIGGGIEFPITELIGGELKISLHPDFSLQYHQYPIGNVINPYGAPGTTISLPERKIRNTTLEIGVGIRLLRKVILVD